MTRQIAPDPHLDEGHRELAGQVREFGERHLMTVVRQEESPEERARELGRLLGEAGLLASMVPRPFGSMDGRSVLVAREVLASFSLFAETLLATQGLAAHLIDAAGAEIQRNRWLPALADGSALAATAFAEPDAGSDLAAVRTEAEPDGTHWRLSGVKSWVSGAPSADVHVVLARSPETADGETLSLFLVDGGAPGLVLHPIDSMATLPVGEVRLDQAPAVRLDDDTRALRAIGRAAEALRAGAAGAACGLASRALDETVRHALARRQFGQSLASYQITRVAIANTHAEVEAARRLARHAAWLHDAGAEDAAQASAAARVVAVDAAEKAVDRALRVHGAQGLVRGSTVERLFRESRTLRLREGTTEMVRLELADALLKESR